MRGRTIGAAVLMAIALTAAPSAASGEWFTTKVGSTTSASSLIGEQFGATWGTLAIRIVGDRRACVKTSAGDVHMRHVGTCTMKLTLTQGARHRHRTYVVEVTRTGE